MEATSVVAFIGEEPHVNLCHVLLCRCFLSTGEISFYAAASAPEQPAAIDIQHFARDEGSLGRGEVGCRRLLGFVLMLHGDNYFSSGMSFSKIPECFSRLT